MEEKVCKACILINKANNNQCIVIVHAEDYCIWRKVQLRPPIMCTLFSFCVVGHHYHQMSPCLQMSPFLPHSLHISKAPQALHLVFLLSCKMVLMYFFVDCFSDQEERTKAIEAFKEGKKDVLVATDVASKGLDFPAIQHVVNYDMPEEIENYGKSAHVYWP